MQQEGGVLDDSPLSTQMVSQNVWLTNTCFYGIFLSQDVLDEEAVGFPPTHDNPIPAHADTNIELKPKQIQNYL